MARRSRREVKWRSEACLRERYSVRMASTCPSETTWTTTFPSSSWTEPPLPTPASYLSCRAIPHLCAASSLDRGIRSRLWWRERFFFGGLHEIRSTKQRCRKSRGNQKRFPYEPGQG